MLAKRIAGRRYRGTDPTGAIQRIRLTVNVLLVYPTRSEGNQAMWLLPLPFPRAFVSQITLQWGSILLCSLISKHITLTHSHSIPLEWEYQGIKGTLPERSDCCRSFWGQQVMGCKYNKHPAGVAALWDTCSCAFLNASFFPSLLIAVLMAP